MQFGEEWSRLLLKFASWQLSVASDVAERDNLGVGLGIWDLGRFSGWGRWLISGGEENLGFLLSPANCPIWGQGNWQVAIVKLLMSLCPPFSFCPPSSLMSTPLLNNKFISRKHKVDHHFDYDLHPRYLHHCHHHHHSRHCHQHSHEHHHHHDHDNPWVKSARASIIRLFATQPHHRSLQVWTDQHTRGKTQNIFVL